MSKLRSSRIYLRFSFIVCAFLLALLAAPIAGGITTQPVFAGSLYSVPITSVMIPAGGTAQFQVRGMALQPGAAIPAGPVALAAQPFPADRVRIALYYGINWGYTESSPQQAVLAVWYAQDNTWHSDDHAIAGTIVSAAANAPAMPSWNPGGRSAVQLSASGQVALSQITFTPSVQSPAMGNGTLTVTNTSGGELNVHLPYGALFGAGSNATLVWAIAATVSTLPAATATTPNDVPPTATDTLPTQQPTAQGAKKAPPVSATATPVLEDTATPTHPALPPEKAPPVSTSKYANTPTATVEDTATPTDTPTDAPTNTSTSTSVPTSTATNTSVATATSTSTQIPPTVAKKQAADNATKPGTDSAQATKKSADNAPSSGAGEASTGTDNAKVNSQTKNAAGSDEAKQAAPPNPANKGQTGAGGKESLQAGPVVPLTSVPPVSKEVAAGINAAPLPVGTAIVPASTIPAGNPAAVQTINPTVQPQATTANGNATATKSSLSTSTVTPQSKSDASPTIGSGSSLGGVGGLPPAPVPSVQGGQPPLPVPSVQGGQGSVPTSAPTATATALPTVQAQPTKLIDVAPAPLPPGPVIDTTPDKATPTSATSGLSTDNAGSAPNANPKTGAGPSTLPIWLSLASGLLVLGGWKLRRLGAVQTAAARINVEG